MSNIYHAELIFFQKVRVPLDGLRLLRKSLSLSLCVWSVCDVWMLSLGASPLLSCSLGETWAEVLGEVLQ